ncbi:unnamed protein product, partial [Prorocentrum cordatum]
ALKDGDPRLSNIIKRANTEVHTLDSLRNKAKQYRRTQDELNEKQQADEESRPDGTSDALETPRKSVTGASSAAGPVLSPSGVRSSMSSIGDATGRIGKTPGAKPRGRTPPPTEDGLTENLETIERKIRAVDLNQCWSGVSMGRQIRWAKEAYDAIVDKGDIRDTNDLEKLHEHWELAEAIGAIVEKPFKSIPSDKLEANLKVIEDAEEGVPSKFKLEIMRHNVVLMQIATANGTDNVSSIFHSIAPWDIRGVTGGTFVETFKPRTPRTIGLDGSRMDKINLADSFMFEMFNFHVKQADSGIGALRSFAKNVLDWLDENCPETESYDEFIGNVVNCCKVLVSTSDKQGTAYYDAVVRLGSAHGSESPTGCFKQLDLALKRSTFYTALKDEFMSFYQKTSEYMPEMLSLQDSMEAEPIEEFAIGKMMKALDLMPKLEQYAMPGSFDDFDRRLGAKCEAYVHTLTVDKTFGKLDKTAQAQMLSDAHALLEHAKVGLPKKKHVWQQAADSLSQYESELNMFNATQGMSELAARLTPTMLGDPKERQNVIPMLDSLLAAGGRSSEAHRGSAKKFKDVTLECVCSCASPADAEPYTIILNKICEAEWLPREDQQDLKAEISMLELWPHLETSRNQWAQLGDDMIPRLEHPESPSTFTAFKSYLVKASAHEATIDLIPALMTTYGFCVTIEDDVKTASKVWAEDRVRNKLNELKPQAKGGADWETPWYTGLDATTDEKTTLKRAEDTVLTIKGKQFEMLIAETVKTVDNLNRWSTLTGFKIDGGLLAETTGVINNANATKYTALMLHAFKEAGAVTPKLKRIIGTCRKAINDQKLEGDIFPPIASWAKSLCSFKA